jgi:hypothetical protein
MRALTADRPARRRRALRVAAAVLAVLAGAEGLYLVAGNLLLSTPFLPALLNRRPEKRLVSWRRAWTVVPGRIHASDLALRVQNRPAQWLLAFDRAVLDVDLPALATRRFHLVALRGDGVSLRLRRRLDTRPEARLDPRLLPPLPGLANPPMPPPERLYRRRAGPGWRIDLDRVAVGVREIWIDHHRLTGDGRLTGSLAIRVRGSLAMEDARLRLTGAALRIGDRAVADRLDADLEARFEEFDPTAHRGRAKARFLSGDLSLRGRVRSLARLTRRPPGGRGARWLALGGGGELAARAVLERGVVGTGSWLRIDDGRLVVGYLGHRAEGRGRLIASVGAPRAGGGDASAPADRTPTAAGGAAASPAGNPAQLLALLDDFTVRAPGRDSSHARGSGFALSVRSAPPDLAGPPPAAEIRLVLPESEVTDVAHYAAYLPTGSGLALTGGRGRVRGVLDYSTGEQRGSAELDLAIDGASGRYRDLPLAGDLRLAARVPRFEPAAQRFELAGTRLELTAVRAGGGAAGWWGRFAVPAGTLDLRARRLDATFAGHARDSGPVVALFATRHPALGWFEELLTVEDLAVSGRLRSDRETVALDDLAIESLAEESRLAIRGRLRLAEGGHRGIYLARLGPLTAAVAADDGRREWKLRDAEAWFERRLRGPE